MISEALRYNEGEGHSCRYEIIDPYPGDLIGYLPRLNNLVRKRAEETPENTYRILKDGDILFIDSSHVVKTGSNINFLFLDVLPQLNPGVLIHFHDIPMPREYGKEYHTNPGFRVFWNESYLLQAFLSCNNQCEVLAGGVYITDNLKDH